MTSWTSPTNAVPVEFDLDMMVIDPVRNKVAEDAANFAIKAGPGVGADARDSAERAQIVAAISLALHDGPKCTFRQAGFQKRGTRRWVFKVWIDVATTELIICWDLVLVK